MFDKLLNDQSIEFTDLYLHLNVHYHIDVIQLFPLLPIFLFASDHLIAQVGQEFVVQLSFLQSEFRGKKSISVSLISHWNLVLDVSFSDEASVDQFTCGACDSLVPQSERNAIIFIVLESEAIPEQQKPIISSAVAIEYLLARLVSPITGHYEVNIFFLIPPLKSDSILELLVDQRLRLNKDLLLISSDDLKQLPQILLLLNILHPYLPPLLFVLLNAVFRIAIIVFRIRREIKIAGVVFTQLLFPYSAEVLFSSRYRYILYAIAVYLLVVHLQSFLQFLYVFLEVLLAVVLQVVFGKRRFVVDAEDAKVQFFGFLYVLLMLLVLQRGAEGVVMDSVGLMVEEISKRNDHCLWQSPSKTSSHHDTITEIKESSMKWLWEKLAIFVDYFSKDQESGFELYSDLVDKGNIQEGLLELSNFLIRPIEQSFCDIYAIKIRPIKGFLTFHIFVYQEEGQDIEVLIIVVLALENIVFTYDAAQL